MGHISVILPLPIVLLNIVVGWREWWAQIPYTPPSASLGTTCLSLQPPCEQGWDTQTSCPGLLGTIAEARQAAFRGLRGLVRAEPGNVHFAETSEGHCKTV